jgi:hypothetical protein
MTSPQLAGYSPKSDLVRRRLADFAMTWSPYHESTKHSVASLRRMHHVLDRADMSDPFRHYEGVRRLTSRADRPVPATPALELLQGTCHTTPVADGRVFLSQLLFYSVAISASKRDPSSGYHYAWRVTSSRNLHPTESTSSHGSQKLARWAAPLRSVPAHGGAEWARCF